MEKPEPPAQVGASPTAGGCAHSNCQLQLLHNIYSPCSKASFVSSVKRGWKLEG